MSVTYKRYLIDAVVETSGGNKISLVSDKAESDYCVFGIDDNLVKLSQSELKDLVQMLTKGGNFTLQIK